MGAKFVKLVMNENGFVNLTVDFEEDVYPTVVEFHIKELQDWLYDNFEDFGEDEDIENVSLNKEDENLIEITTQKGNTYYIHEDDEEFMEFLNL